MIIDFNNIEEEAIAHFKGGEDETHVRMFFDGVNRIMKGRLRPGASIGRHKHEAGCEVIFITKGCGHVLYDGSMLPVTAGSVHYCPKGHEHSLINDSSADLEFAAVVAQQ